MAGALYVIFGYIFLNIFLIIFITAINCRFKWNSWKNPFRTVWRARKVFKKPFWKIYIGPYHGGTYFHFALRIGARRWLEQQLYFVSEEYQRPFGLISITYRYRTAGRI